MGAYVTRRILTSIPTLLVIVTVAFFMMRIAPGGPFDRERALPPEIEKNVLAAYNLDQPLLLQYGDYLLGRAAGRFRAVVQVPRLHRRRAADRPAFRRASRSAASRSLLAIVVGIGLGTLAALRQNTGLDHAVMATAMTGITIPNFVMAPLLTLIFGVYLSWLPVAGWNGGAPREPDPAGDRAGAAADRLHRAPDPRQHDRGAARQLHPHRARQGPARAHRGACATRSRARLLPVVSYLGPATAQLVTGSVVIETIFGIPGIGRYFVQGALEPRLHAGDGHGDHLRGADHPAQSRRRSALRPARSEGEAAMTRRRAPATCSPRSPRSRAARSGRTPAAGCSATGPRWSRWSCSR